MDTHDAMAFVARHQLGVLITIRRDGRPQASTITYGVFDDEHELRISVTADRAKTRNLQRDPRAALHVANEDDSQWVVVEGNALLSPVATADDRGLLEDLRELYRAVRGEHPDWDDYDRAMVEDGRRIIVLRPNHAYGQLAT